MDIKYLFNYNGIDFYYVDEIESTNTYLKEHYNEYKMPLCLIAKKQTKGRGRYDRVWESSDDLIFSLLFDKFYLNEIISPLSIVLLLKDKNINSGIKWPNDVYVDNKKLSGILIENIYESNNLLASIVGIGINKCKKDNYESSYLLNYLSDFSNIDFIKEIIDKYLYLMSIGKEELINLYKNYSIYIGKKIIYRNDTYIIDSIDDRGYLVVKDLNNNLLTIKSDEINIKEALKKDEN